jgi:hypothetical protein
MVNVPFHCVPTLQAHRCRRCSGSHPGCRRGRASCRPDDATELHSAITGNSVAAGFGFASVTASGYSFIVTTAVDQKIMHFDTCGQWLAHTAQRFGCNEGTVAPAALLSF